MFHLSTPSDSFLVLPWAGEFGPSETGLIHRQCHHPNSRGHLRLASMEGLNREVSGGENLAVVL